MANIVDPTLGQVIANLAYVFEGAKQVPVLEDSITFDTGGVTKTEVKLTTKQVITSKIDKDDSDISYDVVYSLDAGAHSVISLKAESETNVDVTFVTISKDAKVVLFDATLTRSYQNSGDGVLVEHVVVTPSALGMMIEAAASNQEIQAPSANTPVPSE